MPTDLVRVAQASDCRARGTRPRTALAGSRRSRESFLAQSCRSLEKPEDTNVPRHRARRAVAEWLGRSSANRRSNHFGPARSSGCRARKNGWHRLGHSKYSSLRRDKRCRSHRSLLPQVHFHFSSEPACATGNCQRRRIAISRRPKQITAPNNAATVGAMANWCPITTTTAPASAATAYRSERST